jgi:hypothetical protein
MLKIKLNSEAFPIAPALIGRTERHWFVIVSSEPIESFRPGTQIDGQVGRGETRRRGCDLGGTAFLKRTKPPRSP